MNSYSSNWIHPTKAWWSQLVNFKMQSDTLEEWYAIKLCFKLIKNATETCGMPQTSCMNRASVFEWHKRFKEGEEAVRNDEVCVGGVDWPKGYGYVEVLREFRKRFRWKRPALFKSGQWHFYQDNTLVHNSILFIDYLTKMGIKTVPQPPYSPDLAPCDFSLFPKLTAVVMRRLRRWKRLWRRLLTCSHKRTSMGCSKLLERYKCIAAGGDYIEGD